MHRFSDLNLPAKNWTSSCAQDTLGMIKVERALCHRCINLQLVLSGTG